MVTDYQAGTGDQLSILGPDRSIGFAQFHRENPHVYRQLVKLCRQAKRSGRDRWSINGVFEVLRWSTMITTGDDFKLNNDYRADYARLVMAQEPELNGFFETRSRRV